MKTNVDSKARRVAKNTAWLFLASLASKLLSLALMVVLARTLGNALFGRFSLAGSVTQIFIVLSELGLTVLTIRDLSRDPSQVARYTGGLSVLRLIIMAAAFPLLVLTCHLLGYAPDVRGVIYLLYVYYAVSSVAGLIRAAFVSQEMMAYDSAITLIEKLTVVGPAIAAIHLGYGLYGVASAFIFGCAVNISLSLYLVSIRFKPPELFLDAGFWRKSLKESYPFALAGIVSMFFLYIDTVILEYFKGDAEVGLYSAAFGLIHQIRMVPAAFLGAAFPLMTRSYADPGSSLKRVYSKSFKLVLAMGLPFSVGGYVLAGGVVNLVYGAQYAGSVPAFKVLIWSAFIFYLNGLLGYFLLSIDRAKTNFYFCLLGTILNILLNFMLIPRYGLIGASAATVAAEVLVFVLAVRHISRTKYHYLPWALFAKAVAASGLMAAVLFALSSLPLIPLVMVGAAAYTAGLFALKYFDEEDRRLFREVAGI